MLKRIQEELLQDGNQKLKPLLVVWYLSILGIPLIYEEQPHQEDLVEKIVHLHHLRLVIRHWPLNYLLHVPKREVEPHLQAVHHKLWVPD